jgi:hypothetical protein
MTKRTKTILLVVAGLAICGFVVIAGTAVWLFSSAVSTSAADEGTALKTLSDVRARFEGTEPLIALRPNGAALTRAVPQQAASARLQSVQVLTWSSREAKLSRITVPFWLLRMKDGPIGLAKNAGIETEDVDIEFTVEEIERYGPALLLDHTEGDGTRVLVWTE